MGLFSNIIGSATLGGVKGVFEGVGSLAKDIRSAITGEISPDKQAEILEKVNELEAQAKMGQIEINKAEASHRSIFVAGWRPYIGWIAGTAIGLYFIPQYLMATILWVKVSWAAQEICKFPIGEPKGLMELVGLLLGLGTLRMVEKLKDKAV